MLSNIQFSELQGPSVGTAHSIVAKYGLFHIKSREGDWKKEWERVRGAGSRKFTNPLLHVHDNFNQAEGSGGRQIFQFPLLTILKWNSPNMQIDM